MKNKTKRQNRAIADTVRAIERDAHHADNKTARESAEERAERSRKERESRFHSNRHMSQAQAVACNQTFAPWKSGKMPFSVIPPRLKGYNTGKNVLQPSLCSNWHSSIGLSPGASTSGNIALVVGLSEAGYRGVNNVLATDTGVYGAPVLPQASGIGVGQFASAPFLAREQPTYGFETLSLTTGASLVAISTDATPVNAGGTFIIAWLQSTNCSNTNAPWTYQDLKSLGYREHTVASLLDGDDLPSVEMPPSCEEVNDRAGPPAPVFNAYTRMGYLVLLGQGLYPGSYLTLNLDLAGLWWGSAVQGSRKVVVSQDAIDCVETCLMGSRRDSSLGASNPYGPTTSKTKAQNVSESAGWYSMITQGGKAALDAAKAWATSSIKEFLPSAFI